MTTITMPEIDLRALAARDAVRERDAPKHRLWLPEYTNLVQNGGFDSDTVWEKAGVWTITGGVAYRSAASTTPLKQSALMSVGLHYSVTYSISDITTGTLTSRLGDTLLTTRSTNGTFSEAGTASLNGDLAFVQTSVFDGDLDNVSLWEANPDNNAPWLRLPPGFKPYQVVRDGVYLHQTDYHVRQNGPYQYFVEPIAAPGVATRFAIEAEVI